MYDWLDELKEMYEGKQIREDAQDTGKVILNRHCASYNLFSEYEISLLLLDRGYYTDEVLKEFEEDYIAECKDMDEEPEEFWCEEMEWTVSCTAIIELDEGVITDIRIEDKAYGDEGLGDYNPFEIYTDEELERIEHTVREYLYAIVQYSEEDD